jgi:hypothetical protein
MTPDMKRPGLPIGPAVSPRFVAWRRAWLVEAGFEPVEADRIASTEELDLHALLSLVDRGCPPALAARILSAPERAGE